MTPGDLAAMLDRHLLAQHGVEITPHARDRMDEMGVPVSQVVDVVSGYSVRRPCSDGREMLVSERRPEWAVVVEPGTRTVVTVLYRTAEPFERPAP